MSINSNLYAEKIFSEHPVALWPLDDESSYISLISETERNLSTWEILGAATQLAQEIDDSPFPESVTNRIIGEVPTLSFSTLECKSSNIANLSSLNSYLSSMSFGLYLYSENKNLNSIEFGYEYYDPTAGENVQVLKRIKPRVFGRWFYISETFQPPRVNAMFRLVIKVRYQLSQEPPELGDYSFLVNGITLGQWSEEFQSFSLGLTPTALEGDVPIAIQVGIPAKTYGLQNQDGYYLVEDNQILAKNSGIPMVFGSSSATSITAAREQSPSLIIPGLGFLNKLGQYRDYSLELWIRVDSNTIEAKRILGPIASSDGLYVEGPFLTLKIGDSVRSHSIGEWYRPMLIQINLINDSASLIVNGEQVFYMDIVTSELDLPDEYAQNMHQDWIGVYAYADVSPIEIDCLAIYPYQVSEVVAKRRFVYGQGVEFPEGLNTAYSGSSAVIDYEFSNYANNYSYPGLGSWNQGTLDNLNTDGGVLSTPKYLLPEISFTNKSYKDWIDDLSAGPVQSESDNLMSLRPNPSWSNTEGFILFESLRVLKQDTKCVYASVKMKSFTQIRQDLLVIENEETGNFFSISVLDSTLSYTLTFNGIDQVLKTSSISSPGEVFLIGINFSQLSKFFGNKVASFFGNKNRLKVYIGGNKSLSNTFGGNIYSIGFCTERNYSKISDLFAANGMPENYQTFFEQEILSSYDAGSGELATSAIGGFFNLDGGFVNVSQSFWNYYIDGGSPESFAVTKIANHKASYTLVPVISFGKFKLDVSIDGYWEDHIPLSHFAKYVEDSRGDSYYDIDFIQLNVDYPAPSRYTEFEEYGEWTYDELRSEYQQPVQRSYNELDNELVTGFRDYLDLSNRVSREFKYDTSRSFIKTYVTFQKITSGANAKSSAFLTTEQTPQNGVIEPGANWLTTRYEVVDNVIIYPPSGVDLSTISIVTSIEFSVNETIDRELKIRSLQYASQSLSYNSPNAIGTRFGKQIYPYRKSGVYFDYKSRNPVSIYKSSSPYLYLTKNSGIKLRGGFNSLANRGISIPINEGSASNYKIATLQAAIRYDENAFPQTPIEIFEMQGKDSYLKFYLVSTHRFGKRGKIYALNANTGRLEDGLAFYWNGALVRQPEITIGEWGMLGIGFSTPVNLDNFRGSFRVTGPILLNSFSAYQFTNLQQEQQIALRKWLGVKDSGQEILEWSFWSSAYLWQGVLVLSSTSFYGITPEDVYRAYTGTNRIVIDDDVTFRLNTYQYSAISEVIWQTNTIQPV